MFSRHMDEAGYHPMREYKEDVLCVRQLPKKLIADKPKLKHDLRTLFERYGEIDHILSVPAMRKEPHLFTTSKTRLEMLFTAGG